VLPIHHLRPLAAVLGLDSLANPLARPSGRCNRRLHRLWARRSQIAPKWYKQPTLL